MLMMTMFVAGGIVVVVVGAAVVVVVAGSVVVGAAVVVVVAAKVVVVTGSVVVVLGNVVVGSGSVVVAVLIVELVVVVDVVTVEEVVVVAHGQLSVTAWPTAFFRQMSASLAVIPPPPLVSQMHSGVHTCEPTAACKMNKQSDAVGFSPLVIGWLQSPWAACAVPKEAA